MSKTCPNFSKYIHLHLIANCVYLCTRKIVVRSVIGESVIISWTHQPYIYLNSHVLLAGGNQRELARAKNQKKLQDAQRSKKGEKEPGAMTLEQRKHR
jgi:hypothetical protein